MKKTLFDFDHYADFLAERLPNSGEMRGSRSRLADHLGCQTGFVSQVILKRNHFSLEHALATSRYLELNSDEQDYFILLVLQAKAGTPELSHYFESRLKITLDKRRQISERIQVKTQMDSEGREIYYSSWTYSAAHMLLFLEPYQSTLKLARKLGISVSHAQSIVDFLVQRKMAAIRGEQVVALPARLHIPQDSPSIQRHHTNWRLRAVQSLAGPSEDDLHYSGVFSLSRSAAREIREILLGSIQSSEPIIRDAKDETVFAMNIDWFGI